MSALHDVAVPRSEGNDVEVLAKAARQRFTVESKLRILREADACTQVGELRALRRSRASPSPN